MHRPACARPVHWQQVARYRGPAQFRGSRFFTQRSEPIEAGQVGQMHVQQDEVWLCFACPGDAFLSGPRSQSSDALALQAHLSNDNSVARRSFSGRRQKRQREP